MWITLLFIVHVGCEWVQISQQHYRKSYRPVYNHHVVLEDEDYEYEEETTPKTNRIYINQSMQDFKWKDSDLSYKKDFVTKVEADDVRDDTIPNVNKIHANNAIKNVGNKGEEVDDSETYAFKFNNRGQQHVPDEEAINDKGRPTAIIYPHDNEQDGVSHTIPKRFGPDVSEAQDVFEESYHIIPNVGSIKKVHLDSRTVRTPILKDMTKEHYGQSSHNSKPPVSENYNVKDTAPSRPIIIWKNENQTQRVIPGIIQKVSKEDLERIPFGNKTRIDDTSLNNKEPSKNKKVLMTHVMQSNEGSSRETVKLSQMPNLNFEKPVFVTKEDFEDEGVVTISSDKIDIKTTESVRNPTDAVVTETFKSKVKNETKESSAKDKINTMENVLKFMRIVSDIISRNTRRSVGSKVRYLENLQDTIMTNIKHRVDTLWPDDDQTKSSESRASRKTRSAATPRGGGHMEFPSSESALMTISFLTFAVYLIKLVLQVIHTYKNKAMMLTPAVVTAVGRTVTAAVYRRPETSP